MTVAKFITVKIQSEMTTDNRYRGVVQHSRIYTKPESYELCAENSGYPKDLYSAVFCGLAKFEKENAGKGCSLLIDGIYRARNSVRGSFQTSRGPWVKGVNLLEVGNTTLDPFRNAIAGLTFENMTEGAHPIINTVYSGEYDRIVASQQVEIRGVDLGPDVSDPDQGVYVETMQGVKVATASISYSDLGLVICTFATLPAAGQYRICVATTSGMGEGIGVAVAKRIVNVA